MKIKVSEATPLQLNWLVAKCEGYEVMLFDQLWRDNATLKGYPSIDVEQHLQWQHQKGQQIIVELRQLQLNQRNPEILTPTRCAVDIPNYSTDWSKGGPIIEREGIEVRKGNPLYFPKGNEKGDYYEPLWIAGRHHGQTQLIAAMRCFCASRLGDEVEVPDELI